MNILAGYLDNSARNALPTAAQSLTTAARDLKGFAAAQNKFAAENKNIFNQILENLTKVLENYQKLAGTPSPAAAALLLHESETSLRRACDHLSALTISYHARPTAGSER